MACITTSTTTAWCPISYQLRFAFKCDNSHSHSHSVLIRQRIHNFNHRVHLFSLVRSGNGLKRVRCKGNLMVSLNSSVDGFAGWSGDDDNQAESGESDKNRFFKGIFGAGLAGAILVAGLTFAAMSLNKRIDSRKTQQMEPLTTQQEVSLDTDTETENDGYRDEGNVTTDVLVDVSTAESNKGTVQDSFLRSDFDESASENKSGDDTNVGTTPLDKFSNMTQGTNNALVQEDLQDESAYDDTSAAPHMSTSSPELPDSMAVDPSSVSFVFEDTNENPVEGAVQLTPGVTEDMVDLEPFKSYNSDTSAPDLYSDYKDDKSVPGDYSQDSSLNPSAQTFEESSPSYLTVSSQFDGILDHEIMPEDEKQIAISIEREVDVSRPLQISANENYFSLEVHNLAESVSSGPMSVSTLADPSINEQDTTVYNELNRSKPTFESLISPNSYSSVGIPAPSTVSAALQVHPGKILVPAVVDQVQGQALAALQVLKVIEADVLPSDLCTRREYARWLVSASSALSRNTSSKVYPAMFIENVTELAFDDITPEDPDFSSIQGLAEAGLISSKLSRSDLLPSVEEQSPLFFHPESPLSRQDLVSWKMALEKTQLPETDKKTLYKLSGFIDIDKINQEAWPALLADISAGEQGIIALAFGYTRLFQPTKPVTKAQAAIALSTGEASDMVNEELARIEAESMAENAVSAHSALVSEVEKDINASFEKELSLEREKISAVEIMAEEAKRELEKLRAQCEEDNVSLMKERTAVESQMDVLLKLRGELEVQLESLMSNKVEMSYEKERISTLRKEAETETKEITRLQYELEVERKALSMARSWAEDEAKKAREQAKLLEEARDRWEKHGIKVFVDPELQEDASAGVTWLNAGEEISVEKTIGKGEKLTDKLKIMALEIQGKSRERINQIIQMIQQLISNLREWISKTSRRTVEIKNCAISKARVSAEDFQQTTVELKDAAIVKAKESAQAVQQKTAEFNLIVKEGAKRVAGDCKEGVEKLTQKFKA